MGALVGNLDSLSVQEPIFKDVKYYVSGDVSEKILMLLQAGGAEQSTFFSDYVTHLICGQNAADTDLDYAQNIYQIPAVTTQWVIACIRLNKLANPRPYNPNKNQIFSKLVACISKVSPADTKALYALLTYHGGRVKLNFDTECTHLICGSASGKKYTVALSLPTGKVKIVTPDWVLESLKAKIQAATDVFHPKLIIVPRPPQDLKMETRISTITGFDFEDGLAKNDLTPNLMENKHEKLKQRMLWDHPSSTASSTSSMIPTNILNKAGSQADISLQNLQSSAANTFMQTFAQSINVSQAGISPQNQISMTQQQQSNNNRQQHQKQPHGLTVMQLQQQKLLQQRHQLGTQMLQQQNKNINQQSQQSYSQQSSNFTVSQINHNRQQHQKQPHGLTVMQLQQQKLLQQRHQLGTQMLQQQNKNINQQSQQSYSQQSSNFTVSQINQSMSGPLSYQPSPQHIQQYQQNLMQGPNTSMSQAQQIENISQMLSQYEQQNMQTQQQVSIDNQQAQSSPQQVLINQHTGEQQNLVHGNQQVTLEGGQQIVSQGQIIHQGGQIVQQVSSQGNQHVMSQGSQHQVVIAQSSQQIASQPDQQVIGQTVTQGASCQSATQLSVGGTQQIITHGEDQQMVQDGEDVSWRQQQYLQQTQQAGGEGPRASQSSGAGGRQLIHLDDQTCAQLQHMDPQRRATFVALLQRRRQLSMLRAAVISRRQAQKPVVGA